jgi:1-aminocyclopropane-1-carboxylate deaminase/D-cysteine desulfhydrase-like pyridoxal-dependent ACC family enzyme
MTDTVRNALSRFPRLARSLLPTPVHRLDFLADRYGCGVYCKRDDMTGFGFGGNKTRKLDFIVADAHAKGYDTLIALGANQSNFCRMAAAYGAAEGLDVHLVLGGPKPETATGNLRLDHLLGATCHHIDDADWGHWLAEGKALEARLNAEGRKAYRMAVGGSSPLGSLGYVDAVCEIMEDEQRLGVAFDAVFVTTSSGGTHAGLVAGKDACGWDADILGVSVADRAERATQRIRKLARETGELIGTRVSEEGIRIDDTQLGGGYAKRTAACEQSLELMARRCGVFVDYVYTGKTAAALLAWLEAGRFDAASNVLFLHTGGAVELFE